MLTEQMIWFLLIFSVPFVPAIMVFLLIKPQSGDAKVGGSLPFFKELKIELAGAIATYLVIVLLAIVAYRMITNEKLISLHINPVTEFGETVLLSQVDPAFRSDPKVYARLKDGSGNYSFLGDFNQMNPPYEYVAEKRFFLPESARRGEVEFRLGDGTHFIPKVYALNITEGKFTLNAEVRSDMISDWTSLLHSTSYTLNDEGSEWTATDFMVFQDTSTAGPNRFSLGTMSILGLTDANLQLWRVDEASALATLEKIRSLLNGQPSSETSEALTVLEGELLASAERLSEAVWSPTGDTGEPYVPPLHTQDGQTKFLGAPSARIDLKPNWRTPNTLFLIRITTKEQVTPEELMDRPALSIMYNYPTELAIIRVQTNPDVLALDERKTIAELDIPGTTAASLSPDRIYRSTDAKFLSHDTLPRSSRIDVALN